MTDALVNALIIILLAVSGYFVYRKVQEEKMINKTKIPPQVRRWKKPVKMASDEFGVPFKYAFAVLWQESGGNPNATGNAGEIGLMQLKPIAVQDVKNQGDFDNWKTDPVTNIRAGVAFLKNQYERTGNWADALRAYNQGFQGMQENPGKADEYLANVRKRTKFFT